MVGYMFFPIFFIFPYMQPNLKVTVILEHYLPNFGQQLSHKVRHIADVIVPYGYYCIFQLSI